MAFDNFFDDQYTSNPLVEMGNTVAENSPFGNGSTFTTNICGEHDIFFHDGAINGERLLKFLIDKKEERFRWDDYLTDRALAERSGIALIEADATYVAPIIIFDAPPLINFAQLNKRICEIDYTPAFYIGVDLASRSIDLVLYYYYRDANLQFGTTTTTIGSDIATTTVTSKKKYQAIVLRANDATTFQYYIQQIGMEDIKSVMINKFQTAQRELNRNNLEQIDWFYSQLPDFIVQSFDKEVLWEDLKALLRYDHSSMFMDNSSNIIKVMRGIVAQEGGNGYLYNLLYSQPKLLKSFYESLNGEETHEGEVMPRKSIFAALLLAMTFSVYDTRKLAFETVSNFTFDATHRVDSNVFFSDKFDDRFNLTQESKVTRSNLRHGTTYEAWDTQPGRTTEYLHPLDLVNVTFPFGEADAITVPFPAIMVKDMAYKDEWENIDAILRAGFNIIAIIGGVVVLATSGNPLVLLMAAVDVGLATVDLLVQGAREELMKTPEGREFLATWESIYTIGGLAIAVVSAPQLLRSVIRGGANLLGKAVGATRSFLKKVLVSMILEINIARFSKTSYKTVDVGLEVLKSAKIEFPIAAVTRLEEQGVIFVRLVDDAGVESYAAVYKGETIVPPSKAQELRKELRKTWNKTGDDLVRGLDEILELERRIINEWDDALLLSKRSLKKRVKNLTYKYKNFKLEVKFIDETTNPKKFIDWNARNVLGSFNPGPPPKLNLRRQVTELTLQHEIWHLEDLKKLGKNKYYETPNWKHEESVWEKVWETRDKWTEKELVDSYRYYKNTAKKETGKFNSIDELDSLLEKPYYRDVRYKQ